MRLYFCRDVCGRAVAGVDRAVAWGDREVAEVTGVSRAVAEVAGVISAVTGVPGVDRDGAGIAGVNRAVAWDNRVVAGATGQWLGFLRS